jgi:hypothetical protein
MVDERRGTLGSQRRHGGDDTDPERRVDDLATIGFDFGAQLPLVAPLRPSAAATPLFMAI